MFSITVSTCSDFFVSAFFVHFCLLRIKILFDLTIVFSILILPILVYEKLKLHVLLPRVAGKVEKTP